MPNKEEFTKTQVKVSDFIITTKKLNLSNLKNISPDLIIVKIYMTHIPINNFHDKVVWKLLLMVSFLLRQQCRAVMVW